MDSCRRIAVLRASVALTACCFGASASRGEDSTAIDGEAILKSFVERTEANLPVTGEFTLTRVLDLGRWIAIRDHEERQAPGRVVMEPPASVHRCRWARTSTIEALETLPKSEVWRSFYRFPGGMLDGNSPKNFNLIANRTPAAIRPENFYLTLGNLNWREFLEHGEIKHIQRDDVFASIHSIRAYQLIVAADREVATLTIDETSRLWRATVVVNNAVAVELEIQEFKEHEDGRFFPAAATNRMRDLRSGTVIRENTLIADALEFPRREDAERVAIDMKLPAGCEIFDLQKKTKRTLDKPESSSNVARGEGSWEPY